MGMMSRPGRKLDVSQSAQFPPQGLAAHRNTELLPYPLRQIRQSPANDTVNSRQRTALDNLNQRLAVRIIKKRGGPWRLLVNEAVRALGIEPQHPIANNLQPNAANTCRAPA